ETGRDLEIPVESCDHQELLELLWRLRERVEHARMHAARHEGVARTLGRPRGQYGRRELGDPRLDHAPPNAGDHLGAKDDIGVELLAPQVEEAIAPPCLFPEVRLAR